uniref:Ig-like domain-containing protein n=1 Tax=Scleropages formosus TaxID=113540 RepID=A0A8C9VPY5_SCLFO
FKIILTQYKRYCVDQHLTLCFDPPLLCLSLETACHSLRLLVTLISGDTQFPELTLVLMVNDIPVEYYDSNVTRIVSRRHWIVNENRLRTWNSFVTRRLPVYTRTCGICGKLVLTVFINQTIYRMHSSPAGVHVYQKFAACDLEGDSLTRFFLQDAYEGVETRNYDILTQLEVSLRIAGCQWRGSITPPINASPYPGLPVILISEILMFVFSCFAVRPRVRVMRKANVASGKMNIVCLATGFYPRHIKMTLLRDERAVPDEELTAGEVFPNGDGTYQLRRSLALSEEEQRKKHVYTCTVTHLSLDNKLDVRWGMTHVECVQSKRVERCCFIWYVAPRLLIVLSVMGITGTLCWRRRTGKMKALG